MRLTELNPRWFTQSGSPDVVGVTFDCPCCAPAGRVNSLGALYRPRLGVLFFPSLITRVLPPDTHWTREGPGWRRTGETFDTLSLFPSIDCSAWGHWHGFITAGEVR